ncbi:calcium-activated BK potassium channel, alpha subunit [Planoprotostelium fungivorum]|uniref:Calcium-activated BK potassium channel, alpha subunit n=1 Tax=Planoprotostelium fungivorum TaxID=1890364 RepID=A0A2P6NYM2_9EUKA|nr:calcium-activated BK potassium channel, alpha subunit [Planoprotostelium fungivorum]
MADLYKSLFTNIFLLDMFIFLIIALGLILIGGIVLKITSTIVLHIVGQHFSIRRVVTSFDKLRERMRNHTRVIVSLVVFHMCFCLVSVGIFLYYVVKVTQAPIKASDENASDTTAGIFDHKGLIYIEFIISIIMGLSLLIQYFDMQHKLSFFFDATIVPGLIGPFISYYFYGFQFLRFVQLYSGIKFFCDLSADYISDVTQDIIKTAYLLVSLIFCSASFMFVLENSTVTVDGPVENLLDAFYFAFVTLSTVGYGDITPKSASGKVGVIVIIMCAIAVVPAAAGRLSETLAASSSLAKKRYMGKNHVILIAPEDKSVLNFLREFYHEERVENSFKVCILLAEEKISRQLDVFIRKPFYAHRISILVGQALTDGDLDRTNIKKALACFVFNGRGHGDADDARTILNVSSLRQHNSQIPIFAQIHHSRNETLLRSLDVKVIINTRDIRMNILSQAITCPGFAALSTNVIQSFSLPSGYRHLSGWEKEYVWGAGHEVYEVDSMDKYEGLGFNEAVCIIYSQYGALLVGIGPACDSNGVFDKLNNVNFTLYPGSSFIIRRGMRGVILAQESSVSADVRERYISVDGGDSTSDVDNIQPRKDPEEFANESLGIDQCLVYDGKNEKKVEKIRPLADCTIVDTDHLPPSKFVVITGDNFSEISELVTKIREFNFKEVHTIIILCPITPSSDDWLDGAGRFNEVWFVRGDPTHHWDLVRAGAFRSNSIIILGQGREDPENPAVDAKPMMTFQLLMNGNASSVPIVDLIHASNAKYLGLNNSSLASNVPAELSTPYYAGHIFTGGIMDTLMAQAFFNPDIVSFIRQIMGGLAVSIPIRKVFPSLIEAKYKDLFKRLLCEHKVVSLGLFRKRMDGMEMSAERRSHIFRRKTRRLPTNFARYIVMNPEPHLVLSEEDEVIVLIPRESDHMDYMSSNEKMSIDDESVELKTFRVVDSSAKYNRPN